RLRLAAEWLATQPIAGLPLGYFGASTGSAAALVAAASNFWSIVAARRPELTKTEAVTPVRAIVSRGGRPDLAAEALAEVRAPTLLIVGGNDPVVIDLNRQALNAMQCERELVVVPGATHLFEEPGTLDQVSA